MKNLFLFLFLLVVFTSKAQDNRVSGLNSRQFTKYWKVESESPDYKVTFQGDTAEIVSPKGLTLWRKEKMSGKVTIEYDACVVVESDGDRLSDLNCFWMASDPQYPDNLWKREKWRSGKYTTCDQHDHPHFYLKLSMAKVRPKKNVVFGPAQLVVEDVPLPIAVPFGFFPFNSSYSSGFIMPTYGDEMNRGFYLRDGGYYFAISDRMDLKLLGEIGKSSRSEMKHTLASAVSYW